MLTHHVSAVISTLTGSEPDEMPAEGHVLTGTIPQVFERTKKSTPMEYYGID